VSEQPLERFLVNLTHAEREYAYAYGEFLSIGDVEPGAAGLDDRRAFEIRTRLHREWRRRKQLVRQRRRGR
jgi:hypothetical protein